MKKLTGDELKAVEPFFAAAAAVASRSTCSRAHCGSIIVKEGEIIGEGYNSPPLEQESNRHCTSQYRLDRKRKYDTTCCVHAEWRAIITTCKSHPQEIVGSTLYFSRIDDQGNPTAAGNPFCTVCSRMAMDAGISRFALWNDDHAYLYEAAEYDQESYGYFAIDPASA